MLMLTRRIGEKIIIGDNVAVWVTGINFKQQQIKIAIEAPKDITIDRQEIWERKNKEKIIRGDLENGNNE